MADRQHSQEHIRFDENHVHLRNEDDVEQQFPGHPELIEEFKRRVREARKVLNNND